MNNKEKIKKIELIEQIDTRLAFGIVALIVLIILSAGFEEYLVVGLSTISAAMLLIIASILKYKITSLYLEGLI
jgi:hypothetical protein